MKAEFKVYHREYLGKDCQTVEAYSFEEAAEEYAEGYERDTAEYDLYRCPGINHLKLEVESPDGTVKKFKVFAEVQVNYWANEVEG